MAASHIHPRRRAACAASLDNKPISHLSGPCSVGDNSLQKGVTFHTSASPSSSTEDPVLSISSIPHRSPTCPETLEKLVTASDRRVAALLDSIERSLAGKRLITEEGQGDTPDSLPIPRIFLDHVVVPAGLHAPKSDIDFRLPISPRNTNAVNSAEPVANHAHTSDSGIGSSVSESVSGEPAVDDLCRKGVEPLVQGSLSSSPLTKSGTDLSKRSQSSVYTAVIDKSCGGQRSMQSVILGDYASNKIRNIIVNPILADKKFKDYHPIIETVPSRIRGGGISCLRDLEKTLIFLAPVSIDLKRDEVALAHCFVGLKSRSKSPSLYYKFCETSIQYIQTTVQYLNEKDLRRPSDRPYSNNYFVDLIDQVRQYASIMAASRRAEASGVAADIVKYEVSKPSDSWPVVVQTLTFDREEKVVLRNGMNQNGKPAELARQRGTDLIPIEAAGRTLDEQGTYTANEDPLRSMARKRKCDIGKEEWRACRECGKEFKRPCDLTKHEKTHSRPWKCSDESCKYFDLGWPTEKERDRHVNDRHSTAPALFKCLYDKCAYTSKRESNCKQHMEKAHGWEYKRSKSKRGQILKPTVFEINLPSEAATPNSAPPAFDTPYSPYAGSSAISSIQAFSPTASIDTSGYPVSSLSKTSSPEDIWAVPPGDLPLETHFEVPQLFHSPGQSLETPDSQFCQTAHPDTLLSNGTELDFGAGPHFWPPMDDVFTGLNVNAYQQVQQPTPAWSDVGPESKGTDLHGPHMEIERSQCLSGAAPLTPTMQEDFVPLDVGPESLPSHYLGRDIDGLIMDSGTGQDFQLFGVNDQHVGDDLPPMFSDLGSVGGQFSQTGQDPMYETMDPWSLT